LRARNFPLFADPCLLFRVTLPRKSTFEVCACTICRSSLRRSRR
jgi:hypothetical protein